MELIWVHTKRSKFEIGIIFVINVSVLCKLADEGMDFFLVFRVVVEGIIVILQGDLVRAAKES